MSHHERKKRRWLDNPELEDPKEAPRFSQDQLKGMVESLGRECCSEFPKAKDACEGGLYVGLGGLAFALWYAGTREGMEARKEEYLRQALRLVERHLEKASSQRSSPKEVAGLLLGGAGLHLTAGLVLTSLGHPQRAQPHWDSLRRAAQALKPLGGEGVWDEVLVGRAGFLAAVLYAKRHAGVELIGDKERKEMVRAMVESGRLGATHFPAGYVHPPLVWSYHGSLYLGAAHGWAGILQMLLSFPAELRAVDGKAEAQVRATVDFLLDLQRPNGNFPTTMDAVGDNARAEEDELWHWCHGAPGVLHLFLKAHARYRDDKYLSAAEAAAEGVWQRGLLRKGPGICHGVAGNAYAFLLLHRARPQEPKHLRRAQAFAAFIQSPAFVRDGVEGVQSTALLHRTPDCPWSLHEGWAGTLCLYADLLSPDQAEFPLMSQADFA